MANAGEGAEAEWRSRTAAEVASRGASSAALWRS